MRTPLDSDAAPEALTQAAADALRRRGLAGPARLLIDAHRPYLPLIEELAAFGSPLLRVMLGSTWSAASAILTPRGLDALLDRLGQPSPPPPPPDPRCPTPER